MQKQADEKLYRIFGSNVTNFRLNAEAAKIRTREIRHFKKALSIYLETARFIEPQSMI